MMILSSCNSKLGNCCSDYGIVKLLSISKDILSLIQIIVPILLILMIMVQLTKMVTNPEDKKGVKNIFNKVLAAIIVFLTPVIVNIVLDMTPETFEVAACWKEAVNKNEISASSNHEYQEIKSDGRKSSPLINPDDYPKGTSATGSSSSTGTVGNGTARGKEIAAYALKFVGKPYKRGGKWNGELPYTPTDCIGFVRGVYKHFGYDIKAKKGAITSHSIKIDQNHPQAGDIVVYDGHYALATGNGLEIVHAANPKKGVIVSKKLTSCSKRLIGVYRYTG